MLNVAIVDDEIHFLESVHGIISREFKKNNVECAYCLYKTPEEFIAAQRSKPCDVAFLDIMMPGYTGFQLAADMRRMQDNTYIIFVTSNDESVYDAFDFQPFQFLRKDCAAVIENRISHTIKNLVHHMKQNHTLVFQMSFGEVRKVRASDIIAFKSDRNYIEVYCSSGTVLRVRMKMTEIEEELSDFDFVRVHNRWVINMRHIYFPDYPNDEIIMNNKLVAPLSRSNRTEMQKRYAEYLRSLQ